MLAGLRIHSYTEFRTICLEARGNDLCGCVDCDCNTTDSYKLEVKAVIDVREINIAHVLVGKRKEKGITQDDLAHYRGIQGICVQMGDGAKLSGCALAVAIGCFLLIAGA